MEKARVTTVQIGNLKVEGLMFPNGDFGIAVSQVIKILPNSITQNHATRQVKALLGKTSPLPKSRSELYSGEINFLAVPVCNCLSLFKGFLDFPILTLMLSEIK